MPALSSFYRRLGLPAVVAAALSLLAGCSATGMLDRLVPDGSYRGESGIAYGPDPRQRLDVYRPRTDLAPGSEPPPLVVFFHGGTWTDGQGSDFRFVGESLASAGAIVVVPTYRVSPQVRYPAFVEDSAAAVKWAFDHAEALGGSTERIVVMGHSSGAYQAAMVALDARWLRAVGLRPRQLAGFIGMAGPYDFLPIDNPKAQVAFDWPRTRPDTQPLSHASAAAPRTLLLVADGDTVVRPERNSAQLAEALGKAGVEVTFKRYDGVGMNHVTLVGALAAPLRWLAPVRADVLAFLGLTEGAGR